MWESLEDLIMSIVPWILDTSPQALAVQYVFIATASLLHIYQILRMRRDTVVVMSHRRIWFGALLGAAIGLGYYRAVLWLYPEGAVWWLFALYIVGIFITITLFKMLLYAIVAPFLGGRRSLIDTKMSAEQPFNCNWPLIPRCTIQGLTYLVFFGVIFIRFVE